MAAGSDIVLYERQGRIAYVTLNRPASLNSIVEETPRKIREAIERANQDSEVHVIVLQGNGRAFCSGYDLKRYAESPNPSLNQKMPWDPLLDYQVMGSFTEDFMSIWRSLKPVICKVHGYAVAGGSDIALCSDIVLMAHDAKIGYPPARQWGCPTTAMWVFRVGAERAKRLMLTGDLIDGREAAHIGLVSASYPPEQLDEEVNKLAQRMASVPKNQLMMQKLVINQAYQNMGIATTQTLAVLFDGIARHTPEGVSFQQRAAAVGFKQAVKERDSGDPIKSSL